MKIAVTSQNKRTVSGHAGKTTRFVVFTIVDNAIIRKETLELDVSNVLHDYFHGNPAPAYVHPILTMDVVITGSMGPGFPVKMQMHGIEAIMTDVTDVDEVVTRYLEGTLIRLQPTAHHHH